MHPCSPPQVLFNRVGRVGDPAGAFLKALRELELGPVETEELSIVSNYGREALQRVTLVRDG